MSCPYRIWENRTIFFPHQRADHEGHINPRTHWPHGELINDKWHEKVLRWPHPQLASPGKPHLMV